MKKIRILILASCVLEAIACRQIPTSDLGDRSQLKSEIDSFTPRTRPLDVEGERRTLEELNRITHMYLSDAIEWANSEPECDGYCMALLVSETLAPSESKARVEERLEKWRAGRVRIRTGTLPQVPGWRGYGGGLESLVSRGYSKDGRFHFVDGPVRLPTHDSIFRDVGRLDSPGSYLEVGSVLPVVLPLSGDRDDAEAIGSKVFYVGSDKLGHFAATGFEYIESFMETFDRILSDHASHEEAKSRALFATVMRGVLSEVTLLGGWTARVFSYADLAANYAGFMFFRAIIDGESRYLVRDQETGKWRLGDRAFTWQEVIDPGWDEGVNCSHYYPSLLGRDDFQRKIAKQIFELSEETTMDLTCPVSPPSCQDIWRRYSEAYGESVALTLVSPQCSEFARGQRSKVRIVKADLEKNREYYDNIGFYSGSEITRRAKELCQTWRENFRIARCQSDLGTRDSLESCLSDRPRADVESFRCQMDSADFASWVF